MKEIIGIVGEPYGQCGWSSTIIKLESGDGLVTGDTIPFSLTDDIINNNIMFDYPISISPEQNLISLWIKKDFLNIAKEYLDGDIHFCSGNEYCYYLCEPKDAERYVKLLFDGMYKEITQTPNEDPSQLEKMIQFLYEAAVMCNFECGKIAAQLFYNFFKKYKNSKMDCYKNWLKFYFGVSFQVYDIEKWLELFRKEEDGKC